MFVDWKSQGSCMHNLWMKWDTSSIRIIISHYLLQFSTNRLCHMNCPTCYMVIHEHHSLQVSQYISRKLVNFLMIILLKCLNVNPDNYGLFPWLFPSSLPLEISLLICEASYHNPMWDYSTCNCSQPHSLGISLPSSLVYSFSYITKRIVHYFQCFWILTVKCW